MKHIYALLLSLLLVGPAYATHIVGGEISLQLTRENPNYPYRLTLNLYFDAKNGSSNAFDASVRINFFRKRDLSNVGSATLPFIDSTVIEYKYPECSKTTGLLTKHLIYSELVNFPVGQFNDSEGYIVTWERCCRNHAITNIVNARSAAMAFYMEMPPLSVNNTPFLNSSPEFKRPQGDFICAGTAFQFDFSARDADGDSLAYRLMQPLNGFANATNPFEFGSPSRLYPNFYPEIIWQTGFSTNNAIPGNPPLQINPRTGLLSVTASQLGLYVFSVEVAEYRQGRKIGLVRRDFQLQVIDCLPNEAPVVRLREAGKTAYYRENDLIRIPRGQSKCMTFLITDLNAGQREDVTVRAIRGTINFTLSPDKFILNGPNDTIRAELCLDKCSVSLNGEPLIFEVIASDNGCPNAKSDTLRVALLVEPDPNLKPVVSTTLVGNVGTGQTDKPFTFNVNGLDTDNDSLRLSAVGQGFTLASAGMEFPAISGRGNVTQAFKWTPKCTTPGPYTVNFLLTDLRCNHGLADTLRVKLDAPVPNNLKPAVSTTLAATSVELTMDLANPQNIQFDVLANDFDSSPLTLTGVGRGFDLRALGMQFTNQSGKPTLRGPFSWTPNCRMLGGEPSKTFVVDFIADDVACKNRYDTLSVRLTLVDRPTNYEVTPTNVFTPNGDGKNDFFTLESFPGDNCSERFERIVVYNRWGKAVFEENTRDFRWNGSDLPSGEYFYLIEFTKRKFKGPLTLLR